MISRDEYLNVLKRFKDKVLIKVITGIRRCGKSTLLEMFQDYLKENGVEESQIISINLEDLEYNFITDYMTLYKYINDNYEKIILTSDKIPVFNEDGIKIKNVLEWLLDK